MRFEREERGYQYCERIYKIIKLEQSTLFLMMNWIFNFIGQIILGGENQGYQAYLPICVYGIMFSLTFIDKIFEHLNRPKSKAFFLIGLFLICFFNCYAYNSLIHGLEINQLECKELGLISKLGFCQSQSALKQNIY